MKLNWYVLKYLFNDDVIAQLKGKELELKADLGVCEFDKETCIEEKEELEEELADALNRLAVVEKDLMTTVDIDFDRITTGRVTKDKPSAHSDLTRDQVKNIVKNIVATDKSLYIIELYGDTNSMEPNIDDNYIIVAQKYDKNVYEIKKQDIVHYVNPEVMGRLLHRVIDIRTNSKGQKEYQIRGDNNPWADGWFKDDAILGIACGYVWGRENDGETND